MGESLWATVQRTGGAMAFRRNGGYSVVQSNHKQKARVLHGEPRTRVLPSAFAIYRVEGTRLERGVGGH